VKFYWSDREGKSPPSGCTLSKRSFSSQIQTLSLAKQVELPSPRSAKVLKQTFFPDRKTWIEKVEKALSLINRKELQKVVLARVCILELDHAPDPFAIASSLKQKAEGAFVFCLQSKTDAFLGATPERLFARKERAIISEAVAGTRRRGKTVEEDEMLQKELLSSSKDLLEFSPVQLHLQNVLSPLCTHSVSFTPISIHKTKNVQHLYTQCTGTLKNSVKDHDIITSLHPTPALCGTPRHKAFSLIQELEPFDRGLYGGVIGWSTPEASEWIVGIRSCLLRGKTATLFSGTGIVEGSNPETEWDELNQKLKLYDGILDH